ncbi:UDP-N-acetylglucosamine 2-epimerase (hydrolyzing) [Sediminibacterium roseum]|uniref:UDP-N-acetylglucosamine 2-epimerase (Hydrolyzing) n=1 Tax=Sediminibacterium roseum TaxID=1978412 RepID=A0ABW9ZS03_9BACT|nr:UDP-N-acetylglucosamine 2-epimerase [Sediminibacterium roseum]NCI49084.1 UDP-N-acetylglucosamine 2-epimerase (hydrolyzing) [Sediminibacterium roseum]
MHNSVDNPKKVVFLTGTRADYGKLKSLMSVLVKDKAFEVYVFVTGMHMLSKYGSTHIEVERSGFRNIHKFINQNEGDAMDQILVKTISGFSDYIKEVQPDLIIVHGDRLEAMAGAIVGSFNNILTGHVEGGEVSGTIDEIIRHSVSKLSQIHFVANEIAKRRLLQLGEPENSVHVIGSPDIDIMSSDEIPTIEEVKQHYEFDFDQYGILLYHPVTTELDDLKRQVKFLVDQLIKSDMNFVVIYPNNDPGSDIILDEYKRFAGNKRFSIYPSMRFESFLTLLKNAAVLIGNSSAGIREAPHYGVPSINMGTRQNGRVRCESVFDVSIDSEDIQSELKKSLAYNGKTHNIFGDGKSAPQFHAVLSSAEFWKQKTQKKFVDIDPV